MLIELMNTREKERKGAESTTGTVKCALNPGEGRVDVSGTVIATFSFRFVILQNIGTEGKKSARFPIFLVAFRALLLEEGGLGFDICPMFPASMSGLPGLLELLINTVCVQMVRLPSARKSLLDLALINWGSISHEE